MATKRNWPSYPLRLKEELNGWSGLAGFGSLITSAAGLGTGVVPLTVAGSCVTVGAMLFALWRSYPLKFTPPQDCIGKILTIEALDDIHPKIPTIAIIGPSLAGKTTLKQKLKLQLQAAERTTTITASVVAFPTQAHRYIAILDGGGERHSQQAKIAEKAANLCVVIDHNDSEVASESSLERYRVTEEFLKQMRHHLHDNGIPKKNWIAFIINKRDLWKRASLDDQKAFQAFCDNQIEQWKTGNFAATYTKIEHSNEELTDIAALMNTLSLHT